MSAVRFPDTDYLFASARLRAAETRLPGKEMTERLSACRNREDFFSSLRAAGIQMTETKDGTDAEAAFSALLDGCYALAKESLPEDSVIRILQYPYDCHNIKSVLKCRFRDIPPDDLLIGTGSVETGVLLSLMREEDYAGLPSHMGAAVPEAKAAYLRTGDPREIDFLLDKACFRDRFEAADGLPFATDFLRASADVTNVKITRRVLRIALPAFVPSLLEEALVEGGLLDKDFFLRAAQNEKTLSDALSVTPYSGLTAGKTSSAEEFEKRADDHLTGIMAAARYKGFGPEVALSYLYGAEIAVKNLRILLSGITAGKSPEEIRARVRDSYV